MAGDRVIIAGGGASGLLAAFLLARAGRQVLVLEKNEVTGKKLSMTGNGRCNLSNLDLDAASYNASARPLLQKLLPVFGVPETIGHLREAGILVRDEEGALYPVSGQASQVAEALLEGLLAAGADLKTRTQVKEIIPLPEGGYAVKTHDGESHEGAYVILATGGLAGPKSTMSTGDGYYLAERLKLRTTPRLPALVRMKTADLSLSGAHGVRAYAGLTFFADDVPFAREKGEVQLTKEAISGIPVLQASADCAEHLSRGAEVSVSVDLFPDVTAKAYEEMCTERRERFLSATLADLVRGMANSEINRAILARLGVKEHLPVGKAQDDLFHRLFAAYRDFRAKITESGEMTDAQTTRGGVSLAELTDALEARTCPGVYVTGELADVDGRCGGYNLQWAWTSAMCVAEDIINKT